MDFARTETPLHDGRNKSGEGRRVEEPTAARVGREEKRGIQLAVGPQPLWLRNHNFGLAQRIMVKRLATSRHDPLGITDSACKNQLVVVSVQYGPFNTYIPIRSTTIGKSRVAKDPITMHTSWRLNTDIASVTSIGYPHMRASSESSTTKHRILHASGPHPIPPPNDPKFLKRCRFVRFGYACVVISRCVSIFALRAKRLRLDVDVNASQLSCSARRIRRRLAIARSFSR
ncbi:hypothetical protein F511_40905 [Dorcoceras hygrometricum]|uniref:Uncharacterized protein n=1 Tax=Dorcoceras hygrometricum TaxID=472368 RepID=A0A2Z7A7C2_9LAMI|nr:hypothetical protein F511_40905 [Dorcoceras hygrometricum]